MLLLLLLKELLGHVKKNFNKISSFKHEPLDEIFTSAMIFQRYGDEPLFLSQSFQIHKHRQEQKKIIATVIILNKCICLKDDILY